MPIILTGAEGVLTLSLEDAEKFLRTKGYTLKSRDKGLRSFRRSYTLDGVGEVFLWEEPEEETKA